MGKKSKKKGGTAGNGNGSGKLEPPLQKLSSNGDPPAPTQRRPPQEVASAAAKDPRNNREQTAFSSSSSSSSSSPSPSTFRVSKEQSAERGEAEEGIVGRKTMGRFDEENNKGFGNGCEMPVTELVSEEIGMMPRLAPNRPFEQPTECGEAEGVAGRKMMGRFDEEKNKGFTNSHKMPVADLVSEEIGMMPRLAPNRPFLPPLAAAFEPQTLPGMNSSSAVFSDWKTESLQSFSTIESAEGPRWARQDGVESEIHQLREENINLRREVEELKDAIERLLLERQPPREEIIDMQTQSMQPWVKISSINEADGPPATVSDTFKESEQVSIHIEPETKIEVSTAADSFELQYPNSASIIERLIAENTELVEKINEQSALIDRLCLRHSLFMDYDRSTSSQDNSSVRNDTAIRELITTSSSMVEQARPLHNLEPNEIKVGEAQIALSEEVPLLPARELLRFSTESKINLNESKKDRIILEGSGEEGIIVEVDETTIPKELKEGIVNEIKPVNESQPEHELDQNVSVASANFVPLSEAPITGAPVRLFSFMVRFISGADLVKTGK